MGAAQLQLRAPAELMEGVDGIAVDRGNLVLLSLLGLPADVVVVVEVEVVVEVVVLLPKYLL